jgi:hypothetical protein
MAYDSRALSREAAQYNAQEIEAEAELRQLEASLKAMRAKADEARFQKQKSEAAREEAFQKERGERQAAVRESITDHHVEAMKKAIKHEDQHLIDCLKVVAAGDMETNPDATTFVGAMVLRELVGHDDEFLTEIAVKVLADPMFITTNGVQQSQGYNTHPKHHFSPNLASAPPSPTKPHNIDPHSPQIPPISPRLSTYGRDESPQLGTEGNGVAGGPRDSHEDGLSLTEVAGGEAVETPKPSEEQEAAEDNNDDFDEDTSGQQEFPADTSLVNTGLHNGNDVATTWVHDYAIEAEKGSGKMADIEYSTKQDDATEADDRPEVLNQEPSAFITQLASYAKLKRHSIESDNSYESDTASATIAGVYVAIPRKEKEGDLDSNRLQTPQLATPILKKSHAGLRAQGKVTPCSKRSSGKRKHLESEVSTSGAGDTNEMTTTPTKKAKTKAKDESSGKLDLPLPATTASVSY